MYLCIYIYVYVPEARVRVLAGYCAALSVVDPLGARLPRHSAGAGGAAADAWRGKEGHEESGEGQAQARSWDWLVVAKGGCL